MSTTSPGYHLSPNISRLLTAAIINQNFRQLLLSNPEKAISSGYNGETFRFEQEERDLILSIHASSLQDFAIKIAIPPRCHESCILSINESQAYALV